jgi:hypothetical protein
MNVYNAKLPTVITMSCNLEDLTRAFAAVADTRDCKINKFLHPLPQWQLRPDNQPAKRVP